ncbi:MAG: hypothetical protein JF614_23270 [Acidobacteria bacterium]|nr:hypothetical protein [Acidobacteriota bacterium]
MVRPLTLALVLGLAAQVAMAVQIDSVLLPSAPVKAAEPRSLRLAEAVAVPPLASLRAASVGAADQLDAIAAWNRSGSRPAKNGFARPLALPRTVRFTSDLLARQPGRLAGGALLVPPTGGVVWGTEVRVEGSYRVRLHLSNVNLPKGTRLWVYGEGTEEASVAAEDVTFQDGLWTPSVGGPALRLEVRLPEEGLDGSQFTIDQVLETFELDREGAPRAGSAPEKVDSSCLRDAACYNNSNLSTMDLFKKAVAYLEYVSNGQSFTCSGALMNDTDDATTIPYLLTAYSCFSTQAEASSLQAFFDVIDAGCGGPAPSLASVPKTTGSTLLATSATTEFTLVRLSSLPGGRGLLGSTSQAVTNGTVLHGLSFPLDLAMGYSKSTVSTSAATCSSLPRPTFIYSALSIGGQFTSSAGGPVVRESDGRVVGLNWGVCGLNPTEHCDRSNSEIDSALSEAWPALAPFLTPATTPFLCTPTTTALCLNNGRFKVEATFNTGTQSGQAQVVKLTDETGYLWFFSATNVEAVVKVLNACTFNQRFWVFAGGLTNVQVTLTVTDSKNGTVKTYNNPQGAAFQPILDTSAFATCP